MTLNASGPISLAGTTAGQSIEVELGGNGTTLITLNDTTVRTLAGVPSGAITMPTNFWGKSSVPVWTYLTSLSSNPSWGTTKANGIAYGAGKWVVVGDAGKVATSTDNGVTWTYQGGLISAGWPGPGPVQNVTYQNGLFIVWRNSTGYLAWSSDGVTWTYQYTASLLLAVPVTILWTGTRYVAASSGTAETSSIYFSPSGTLSGTWTGISGPKGLAQWTSSFGINTMIYDTIDSVYVAAGANGRLAYSSDAVTWTWSATLSGGAPWTSYVATTILHTPFGYWTFIGKANALNDNTSASKGYASSLTTAVTTQPSSPTNYAIYGVYGNSKIMASGGAGRFSYATGYNTWVTGSTSLQTAGWGSTDYVNSIAYGNSIFMVCGDNGKIATSA